MLRRFRNMVSMAVGLAVIGCGAVVSPAVADGDAGTDAGVVGSFDMGLGGVGDVDERGGLGLAFPVGSVAGISGMGSVVLELSWSSRGDAGEGLGGWGFGLTRVNVDGGVRVVTASGEVFDASTASTSGLLGYLQEDMVFSQVSGVLPARTGVRAEVAYGFSMEFTGGAREFFDTNGLLVARVDESGHRVDWVRDETGRLVQVVDAAGSALGLSWSPDQVRVQSPPRSDGVVASHLINLDGQGRVASVTDPVGQKTLVDYDEHNLVNDVVSPTGAKTRVSWQELPSTPGGEQAWSVRDARVIDDTTGNVLSHRSWKLIGDNTPHGFPTYSDASELWASGDAQFRYTTELSDGNTRVLSTFNSMGLLISRTVLVDTPAGDIRAQDHAFTYAGTGTGGVPDRQNVPANYAKPVATHVSYNDTTGNTRTVSESAEFDALGRVVSSTDTTGAVTETEYDDHVPAGRSLPSGLVIKQTVTSTDGLVTETVSTPTDDHTAIAHTQSRSRTADGTWEDVSEESFTYSPEGFMTEHVKTAPDATGSDTAGPSRVVTAFDRTVDTTSRTVTTTTRHAAGTEAETTTSEITDAVSGLVLQATDEVGRVARTTFDAAGRITTQQGLDGRVSTHAYDTRSTQVRDSRGVAMTQHTDALGRLMRATDNLIERDGVITLGQDTERLREKRAYENNGSTVSVTNARGATTRTASDVFGRLLTTENALGVKEEKEYDDVRNTATTRVVGPSGTTLTATVESMDDVNRVTGTSGSRADGMRVPESRASFDGLGRVVSESGNDLVTQTLMNANGTPQSVTNTPQQPTEFPGEVVKTGRTFDGFGTSTRKTVTQGETTSVGVSRVVDEGGRTRSETNQTGTTTSFTYTPDGLVATAREGASGRVTTSTHDPVTRKVVSTETTGADGNVMRTAFEYDSETGNLASVYDPTDRENTTVSYSYDVLGNNIETVYPDGKRVSHVFDVNGTLKKTTDIAGNVSVYEHDTNGLLTKVTQTSPEGTVLGRVAYSYDEFARTATVTRENGVTTRYTYTSHSAIATESTTRGNGTSISSARYTYDAHDNLTARTDTNEAGTQTTTYRYNAYDQLTESRLFPGEDTGAKPIRVTEYELGVSGEVTREIVTASGNTTERAFEYNALGQTTGIATTTPDGQTTHHTQEYDAAGNLTRAADGSMTTYNARNQPLATTAPDGQTTTHQYWATGRRAATTDSAGTSTGLYWDGSHIINDTQSDTDTTTTSSYLSGLKRHAHTTTTEPTKPGSVGKVGNDQPGESPATNYYVTDRHGNTTATIDNGGSVTARFDYSDYGQTTTNVVDGQPAAHREAFLYAGEYTTPDGKQFLGNRIYNPDILVFTSRDDADQFNLYAYTGGNPITQVDPTGQTAERDIVDGIFIAATLMIAASTWWTRPVLAPRMTTLMKLGFLTWIPGVAADVGGAAIAATQIIAKHTSSTFTSDTSEKLASAEIGLGAIGAIVGAVTGLSAAANAITDMIQRNAVKASFLARGARMSTNRHGVLKEYHHGTKAKHVQPVVDGIKIQPYEENGKNFGPGFYTTTKEDVAMGYGAEKDTAGKLTGKVYGVTINLQNVTKGVKIYERADQLLVVQNPAWHNKSPASVPKELPNSPVWSTELEASADLIGNYGVEVITFASSRSLKPTVLTRYGTGTAENRTAWDPDAKF